MIHLCATLMITKPSAGSFAFRICEVKFDLYLSSNSLHSLTKLSSSTSSTMAKKMRWQILSSFVMTLCRKRNFLMVHVEWREFQPSATLAAVLEYHLGSWRIRFATSPWKRSSMLMESADMTQFSTSYRRMGKTHVSTIQEEDMGLSLP